MKKHYTAHKLSNKRSYKSPLTTPNMICLGIESTAHTFGAGIVTNKGEVLSNQRSMYTTASGGIHPMKATKHHLLLCDKIINSALEEAKLKLSDLDLIAFSQGPGLGQTLRVGAVSARTLSKLLNVPLLGVNHCVAHIEIGKHKTKLKDPITLYVSGANTQIIAYAGNKYRVFGETLDIGVGKFLDTIGRFMGTGFPGGPAIENLAAKGKKYIELPYSIKGMDFSFAGIQTKVRQLIESEAYSNNDLAFSTQETVFAMLTEATERAIAHIGKNEVLLTGGVAANKRLTRMLETMCKSRKVKFEVCPRELSGDQGAMIAWQGIVEYSAGKRQKISDTEINGKWRTDQVEVNWIK